MISSLLQYPFAHNGLANVTPLMEYTGQQNFHKKRFDPTTDWLTERVIFPQVTSITPE